MQFFPIKTAQGILDIDGGNIKEAFPSILLTDEKYIK